MSDQPSSLAVLIAALGGEGGGVLAEWLVDAATQAGLPVQGTSVPGVAQRTGATSYYVEIFLTPWTELGDGRPVLGLNPLPGRVDVVLASELLEASRVLQNGFISPDRTLVITSSQRTLTTLEKMQMGDGRQDNSRLLAGLRQFSRQLVNFDMNTAARETETILSAVMLGAIAGMQVLPIERRIFEQVIGHQGNVASASLKGFARGFKEVTVGHQAKRERGKVSRLVPASIAARFPQNTHELLSEGFFRLLDYQDRHYAELFLTRVEYILVLDERQTDTDHSMTREFGRFLALWMAYEDVPRVADLKTRRSRLERVRREVDAKETDVVRIVDFFKPTIEELCALLPTPIAGSILRWHRRRLARGAKPLAWPLEIRTDGVFGMLALRTLAALRILRRASSRFAEEQRIIAMWTDAIEAAALRQHQLAMELVLCGRLIKGYGDTHRRGKENFLRILESARVNTASPQSVHAAREAALADPDGRKLDSLLVHAGLEPRPIKAQPIQWTRRAVRASQRT